MSKRRRWILGLGLWVAAEVSARAQGSARPGPVTREVRAGVVDPRAFGTDDYSIAALSAVAFSPRSCSGFDRTTLSWYYPFEDFCSSSGHFYASLDLPAGAVIDYIGVNTATTLPGAMGFTLHFRDHLGGSAPLASATLPTHDGGGFGTDYAGPLGILVPDHHDREFLLDVEVAPGLDAPQYFGFAEIWWRRSVSSPPVTPTFGDVPNGHPFYQFVEALSASAITGGCGNGNYCPDSPLTRGQMAAFLAKALGLHWPE
jgi:hypothetical protein